MNHRKIKVDETKFIDIYDDVFDFSQHCYLYEFVKNCAYRLNRTASSSVPQDKQFKTLLSEFNIHDLLKINFFTAPNLKFLRDKIKTHNFRLHRAYVNLSTAQDVYHYHVDSNIDDDFTLLYYCNTAWEENWEGETHFGDTLGQEIIHSCSFKPNRVVLFTGTIPHKSSQPSFFAKDFRYVLTLKFTHPNHKDYYTDFPISDFFDENVVLTEREINALEFLQKICSNIKHSESTLYEHLKNTWRILKIQKRSEDTCLAGMFHSVYGTEFFDQLLLDRENIKTIIGDSAEDLVFKFCSLTNRDEQLLNDNCFEKELIEIAYANLIEEKFRNMSHESEIIAYKNKLEKIKTK
jgi:hypothetical protein